MKRINSLKNPNYYQDVTENLTIPLWIKGAEFVIKNFFTKKKSSLDGHTS